MNRHEPGSHKRASQRGQSFLIIVIFVALILIAMLGIATDYTQIWAHRQMAQGAADAACQAAAADLYLAYATPTNPPGGGFSWIGTAFDCSAKPATPPCQYASVNGYAGAAVNVSFPASLPGVPPLPGGFTVTNPYVLVTVSDPVEMTFSKLAGATTYTVTAKAGCGMAVVNAPIPLVVLNQTQSGTLSGNGTPSVAIVGGPNRSVQVDSSDASAVSLVGSAAIDLHQAGPTRNGADMAVAGKEAKPSNVNLGSLPGKWISPTLPFGDPFSTYPEPAKPTSTGLAFPVAYLVNGCPAPEGCVEFTAGDYSNCSTGNIVGLTNGCLLDKNKNGKLPGFKAPYGADWISGHAYAVGALIVPSANNPKNFMFQATQGGTSGGAGPVWKNFNVTLTANDNGVHWRNMGPITTSPQTAILDPGLYYMGVNSNGLAPGPNIWFRMSTAAGDGNGGATFLFATSDTFAFGSNTGSDNPCGSTPVAGASSWSPTGCLVSYARAGNASSVPLLCSGDPSVFPPSGVAVSATFDGNIFLGPCSGTYGGPGGTSRGFLFFQKRSVAASATLGGGGSFIFSGFVYMHNGNGSNCGTNTSCISLQGGPGGSSYALGDVVADEVSLGGNATLNMILSPSVKFPQLRPSLLE